MLYPQKPPLTDDELTTFLREAPIARMSSLNPDGTIHIAALWFVYDSGELVFGTQEISNKVRNIRHNPNVTVLNDRQRRATPQGRSNLWAGRTGVRRCYGQTDQPV